MEKKDYTMVGLSMVLLVALGFNAIPEPTHQCDSRELEAYCFSLSSTNKTCYTLPANTGGKRCSSLWQEIPMSYTSETKPSATQLKASNANKWSCNTKGCTEIGDD